MGNTRGHIFAIMISLFTSQSSVRVTPAKTTASGHKRRTKTKHPQIHRMNNVTTPTDGGSSSSWQYGILRQMSNLLCCFIVRRDAKRAIRYMENMEKKENVESERETMREMVQIGQALALRPTTPMEDRDSGGGLTRRSSRARPTSRRSSSVPAVVRRRRSMPPEGRGSSGDLLNGRRRHDEADASYIEGNGPEEPPRERLESSANRRRIRTRPQTPDTRPTERSQGHATASHNAPSTSPSLPARSSAMDRTCQEIATLIEALPRCGHSCKEAAGDTSQQNCCPICLDDYEEAVELTTLPCMHRFHTACITDWLLKDKCGSCPMCKRCAFQDLPISAVQRRGRVAALY